MSRDRGAEEPEFEPGYTGWTSEEKNHLETVGYPPSNYLYQENCGCLWCVGTKRMENDNGTSNS